MGHQVGRQLREVLPLVERPAELEEVAHVRAHLRCAHHHHPPIALTIRSDERCSSASSPLSTVPRVCTGQAAERAWASCCVCARTHFFLQPHGDPLRLHELLDLGNLRLVAILQHLAPTDDRAHRTHERPEDDGPHQLRQHREQHLLVSCRRDVAKPHGREGGDS
jgi:hypothetical protein